MADRYDELIATGIAAREKGDDVKWELGDLANEVAELYSREAGRSLQSYASAIGVGYTDLSKYRTAAGAYPDESLRRRKLPWQWHYDARRIPERHDLLLEAEREHWQRKDLQEELDRRTSPEDEPPNPSDEPYVKRGDLFAVGNHRVLCADAAYDDRAVKRVLGGAAAQMLFTAPPYGVDYEGKTADRLKLEGDDLDENQLYTLLVYTFREVRAHMTPGASFYVCAPSGDKLTVVWAAVEDDQWADEDDLPGPLGLVRQTIVWAKDQFVLGRQDYHWQHELLLRGWIEGAPHRWFGGDDQSTVWEIPRPRENKNHPTMKPVELVARALVDSTEEGDTVIDPFLGSGTTLVAAHQTGRRGFGIEVDPRYAQVAVERLEKILDVKAVRLD